MNHWRDFLRGFREHIVRATILFVFFVGIGLSKKHRQASEVPPKAKSRVEAAKSATQAQAQAQAQVSGDTLISEEPTTLFEVPGTSL